MEQNKVHHKVHVDKYQVEQDHIHPKKIIFIKHTKTIFLPEILIYQYFDMLLVIVHLDFVHDLMLL